MSSELNRRDFTKLAAAAFGGLLTGAQMLPAEDKKDEKKGDKKDEKKEDKKTGKKNPLLYEPHVCRGLNVCKGKGAGGKNACAGQSDCATVAAHTCGKENACRGQGGCQGTAGENACKGMGGCHVPLTDETWTKVRKRFEEVMKAEKKAVGPAPKKKA